MSLANQVYLLYKYANKQSQGLQTNTVKSWNLTTHG